MKDRSLHTDHITLGVCYYPEHWEESLWDDDLERMKEYGIEVIRIAEFAWNKFEPEEGVFTFDFFDRFMERTKEKGMKVIFCTPTATPPLWLSEKYPEILNADIDGNLYYHGTRRHYNLNSVIYREYCRKITEKLAEHYVKYDNIVGWQLDNEINCENDLYYSQSDHDAFRKYCKEKYKTLDNFNQKMGTVFWNQTYTDWQQVHLTRRTNTYGQTNPHLQLEEKRFISESVYSFFKLQADIIRKWQNIYGRENQFITTNGLFRHIDYQRLVEDVLDFITFDNYPAFARDSVLDPKESNGFMDRNSSRNLIRTRSISPIYGIMEQQTGAGGWNSRMMMPMPRPGQMKLWTMQAIAHGGDFVSFFRWRTATMGTEIYWHGLHDYDNRENRRVRELREIHNTVQKLKDVAGTAYQAKVAILCDYENEWDGENDIWHGPLREKSMDSWFVALQKAHIPFDYRYWEEGMSAADLQTYEYFIYPHATIFTKEQEEVLETLVEQGKTVIFGCRSGYKDRQGQCYSMPMPGYIGTLCGCEVEDYTYASSFDEEMEIVAAMGNPEENRGDALMFHDILIPTEGETLAVFRTKGGGQGDCYYENKPAIVRKQWGKGAGWYVGAAFAENTANLLIRLTGMESMSYYKEELVVPETVELAVRKGEGGIYLFLLNYENRPVEIAIQKGRFMNVLTGETEQDSVEIDGYNFLILQDITNVE
ncbi:MAG: beta-galactosidase [Eubacterium sp.]|nr:beta-galactosidase [Eubacterium sp.]